MGDGMIGPLRLLLNPQLRVECRGATATSDDGLSLPRERNERLGLSALIEHHLAIPRTGTGSRQTPSLRSGTTKDSPASQSWPLTSF